MNAVDARVAFRLIRRLGGTLLICALGLILQGPAVRAQTGGPIQKEAVGGSPSSGVDDFTGSFSYTLPLLTVPGPNGLSYPITLSYHSGESPDAGVSWVGYGWSLNPGAIVRDQKGLPDDWQGPITYYNKVKDNWTVSARTTTNLEVTSYDFSDTTQSELPLEGGISYASVGRYNDYMGYSRSKSFGASLKGLGSLTYTADDDGGHFSGAISPFFILTAINIASPMAWYSRLYQKSTLFNIANAEGTYLIGGAEFNGPYPSPTIHFSGESFNYSHTWTLSVPPYLFGISWGRLGNYTRQHADDTTTKTAYGYMYSGKAANEDVTDYHADKDAPYYKKNEILPIPVADIDNFIGTGTAYNGSFRLYSRSIGQFHPSGTTSSLDITQVGTEITGGLRLGIGADFGTGSSTLSVGSWGTTNTYNFPSTDNPRDFMMLAGGDMAASAEYASSDAAVSAPITPHFDVTLWGARILNSQTPAVPSSIYQTLNNTGLANRSTFITFTTRGEINEQNEKGIYYKAYSRDPILRALVDRASVSGIEELAVTDGAGNRLVYGLPVYSRHEYRISYGLEGLAQDVPSALHSNFSAYTAADLNYKRVIGTTQSAPYATGFLLTEMTTSDYVDRTFDGPTPDDYGGYVKFTYARAAGDAKKDNPLSTPWYRWRTPYRGLSYTKGSLSDPNDDLGSYFAGEREVYYLQSIETKTHIAFFITDATDTTIGGRHIVGSKNGRMDAYQAPVEASAVSDSTASGAIADTLHPNFSRKLERIELYTKNASGAPDSLLSTVFFSYDYSLRPGMPNSLKDSADTTKRLGMLTLQKIWFQSQGIVNARIAPYTFGYTYPDSMSYPKVFRNSHPDIAHYGSQLAGDAQNPSYSEYDVDPWGAYQYNGAARYAKLRNWVNQTPDSTHFDPAAWQLKTIRTPAGGETRIQYEQNDYAYVQDRPSSAMVSLLETANTGFSSLDDDDHAQYYLNLADIGVPDSSLARVAKVANMLKSYFLTDHNKIYFKLLYSLLDHVDFTSPEYTSEHITGYGNLTVVRLDTIATSPYKRYGVIIEVHGDGDFNVPRKICRDFVKTNRRGKFNEDGQVSDGGDASDRVSGLLDRIDDVDFNESHYCQEIDFANSYVRIPLPVAKLGGGIRVKRLLSFDPGIEGDSAVYGTEYVYTTYDATRNDTISSGVAANEPAAIKEENALFTPWFSKEKYPDLDTKLIFARDKQQYEGPIAESLLPGASIGYSRVTRRNIHTGESNPGFSITSFYTAKDYPFIRNYSGIGNSVDFTDVTSSNPQQSTGGFALMHSTVDNVWLSQGFRFIQNGMHGKLRSVQTYGGNWNNRDSWHLSSSKDYTYFEPGEKVPVIDSIGGAISYENLGKRMDVFMENRQIEDVTNDLNVEGDITSLIPLDIQPSGFGSFETSESRFHSHVISKVIYYPAIVKGVLTYVDGTYSYAKTDAIDRLSGQPVISESMDGFNGITGLPAETGGHKGLYHTMSFAGFRQYPELGPKATSERLLLNPSNPKIAKNSDGAGGFYLYRPVVSGVSVLDGLTTGDLVVLRDPGDVNDGTHHGFYNVKKISADTVDLLPVSTLFADLDTSVDSVQVEVIRSGRKNQLGASVGQVLTYGLTSGQIDSGTYMSTGGGHTYIANTVSASAALLRDSVVYDTAGAAGAPAGANVYELGRRGRWRLATSYSYRGKVVAGSGRDTSERIWRRAGLIDTFAVFNWTSPSSNDTTLWLRGDSVTRYSYDGIALEAYDPIGIPSAVRLGYNGMLPVATAGNARYSWISFTGFEEDSGSTGVVKMRDAHSGEYCLQLLPGATVTIDKSMALTESRTFSAVLRYWRRSGGDTATPVIKLRTSLGTVITGTRTRIAQTGDWSLFQTTCTGTFTVSGSPLSLYFDIYGSTTTSDTVYIDDLRIAPADAIMACTVFDRKTYRPLVSFDDNHFGTYSQYDAEGRLIRQIVETTEGLKTVAESHGHVPLVDRTALEGGPTMAMVRAPGSGSRFAGHEASPLTSGNDDGTGDDAHPHADASFDLLDFNAGPDGVSTTVLGIGKPDLDSLELPDLASIGAPSVPLLEKKKLIDSLMTLESRARELDSTGVRDASDAEKQAAAEEASALRTKRAELLRSLGLSEEEWSDLKRNRETGREHDGTKEEAR